MDNVALIIQMQGMSIEKEMEIAMDHALFSWMEDEDTMLTNVTIASSSRSPQVQSDYNLQSKRCFMGENVGTRGRFISNKVPE